jgi:hypothetical protein
MNMNMNTDTTKMLEVHSFLLANFDLDRPASELIRNMHKHNTTRSGFHVKYYRSVVGIETYGPDLDSSSDNAATLSALNDGSVFMQFYLDKNDISEIQQRDKELLLQALECKNGLSYQKRWLCRDVLTVDVNIQENNIIKLIMLYIKFPTDLFLQHGAPREHSRRLAIQSCLSE